MILDIVRLSLFPALMAFAAASDLFTMTISNRISLAIIAIVNGLGTNLNTRFTAINNSLK